MYILKWKWKQNFLKLKIELSIRCLGWEGNAGCCCCSFSFNIPHQQNNLKYIVFKQRCICVSTFFGMRRAKKK